MTWVVLAVCVAIGGAGLSPPCLGPAEAGPSDDPGGLRMQQPVEIDRVLQRVAGDVITTLHVRRARLLRLTPGAGTDEAVLRELVNRRLMLFEVARFNPDPPPDAGVAEARRAWEASLEPGTDVPALLVRAGMRPSALDGWFRDNLRLRAYLAQRFGAVPDAERPAAIAAWIRGLRDRAGLR
jgi:hypothetical protein